MEWVSLAAELQLFVAVLNESDEDLPTAGFGQHLRSDSRNYGEPLAQPVAGECDKRRQPRPATARQQDGGCWAVGAIRNEVGEGPMPLETRKYVLFAHES